MSCPTTSDSWRTRPRAAAAALLVALFLPSAQAVAVDSQQEALDAMQTTLSRALETLRDASLDQKTRRERVERLVEDRFDFDRTSRLVLGRNWHKLSDGERAEFVVEFRRHLSNTYGRRLGELSSEKVEITGTRLEKNGDVTVQSSVTGGAAGDGVKIDYRMRGKDGPWKAIDVVIGGVSLLQSFRSQVQEIIGADGAGGLIRRLREKNDKVEATKES